jgi:hypothetical protein
VNLEQIYVDSEEFSFEELLAKKRGIYGLKFEVEKSKSPVENVFTPTFQKSSENNAFMSKLRSPAENVEPKVERSAFQQKQILKTPSPEPSEHVPSGNFESSDVYMPIRGRK